MNTSDSFTKKILEEIKTKGVEPLPRWYFIAKEYALTLAAVAGILIASIIAALVLVILTNSDWFAAPRLEGGTFGHIIQTVPYSLIVIVGIIATLATFIVRHVRRGYRYPIWKTIAFSIIASVIIGTLLLSRGTGKAIHHWLSNNFPLYEEAFDQDTVWVYPEQGLLSGTIQPDEKAAGMPTSFSIEDEYGDLWTIALSPHIPQDTIRTLLIPNKTIKIIGTMQDGSHFTAEQLFASEE